MPQLLNLTDTELDIVMRAARPLAVQDRDAFLQEVAGRLLASPHLGDGIVFFKRVASCSASSGFRRSMIQARRSAITERGSCSRSIPLRWSRFRAPAHSP
jgi:hypothetical protein